MHPGISKSTQILIKTIKDEMRDWSDQEQDDLIVKLLSDTSPVTLRPLTKSIRGVYDHDQRKIIINSRSTPKRAWQALIHERLHAINSKLRRPLTHAEIALLAKLLALKTY